MKPVETPVLNAPAPPEREPGTLPGETGPVGDPDLPQPPPGEMPPEIEEPQPAEAPVPVREPPVMPEPAA